LELEHTVIGDGARRGASASPITGQRPRRISAERSRFIRYSRIDPPSLLN
jgi:hypothetical protein